MKTKAINSLNEGESIVLFTDNYKSLMMTISSYTSRKQIKFPIKYYKAKVIVGDEMKIGVMVTRLKQGGK